MGKRSSDEEWSDVSSVSPVIKRTPRLQKPIPRRKIQKPIRKQMSDEEWSDDDETSPVIEQKKATPRRPKSPDKPRQATPRRPKPRQATPRRPKSPDKPRPKQVTPHRRQKQVTPHRRQKQVTPHRRQKQVTPHRRQKQVPVTRKVQFGKTSVKQISKSETKEKLKALKSVIELDEYTQICVTHILSVFNIWDKDDLKERGQRLSEQEQNLIKTCIKSHEGKPLTTEEKNTLSKYEKKAMKHISEYRKERINNAV